MKKCTKCGEIKAGSDFCRHSSTRDGLRPECKACHNHANLAWCAANRERLRAYQVKYYAENTEKERLRKAKERAKNPELEKARCANYYANNIDRIRANTARWRAENPSAVRAIHHNRRARKIANGGKLSPDIGERLYKLQRGKCACCKQPLGDKYHLDHIMPLALGGVNTDDNVQLLRASCNSQKHAKHPVDFMQERGFLL